MLRSLEWILHNHTTKLQTLYSSEKDGNSIFTLQNIEGKLRKSSHFWISVDFPNIIIHTTKLHTGRWNFLKKQDNHCHPRTG